MEKFFTTGGVARRCGVCNTTAVKWIDTGMLPACHLPGSKTRKVSRVDLIEFMKKYGLPLGDLEDRK